MNLFSEEIKSCRILFYVLMLVIIISYDIITNKPFVCDRVNQLRRRLWTDRNEIWQVDPYRAKERFKGISFRKY